MFDTGAVTRCAHVTNRVLPPHSLFEDCLVLEEQAKAREGSVGAHDGCWFPPPDGKCSCGVITVPIMCAVWLAGSCGELQCVRMGPSSVLERGQAVNQLIYTTCAFCKVATQCNMVCGTVRWHSWGRRVGSSVWVAFGVLSSTSILSPLVLSSSRGVSSFLAMGKMGLGVPGAGGGG